MENSSSILSCFKHSILFPRKYHHFNQISKSLRPCNKFLFYIFSSLFVSLPLFHSARIDRYAFQICFNKINFDENYDYSTSTIILYTKYIGKCAAIFMIWLYNVVFVSIKYRMLKMFVIPFFSILSSERTIKNFSQTLCVDCSRAIAKN